MKEDEYSCLEGEGSRQRWAGFSLYQGGGMENGGMGVKRFVDQFIGISAQILPFSLNYKVKFTS